MSLEDNPEIGRSIFRESNDAFFIVHPRSLTVLEVNPAAQRLTGRRRKQLLGRTVEQLFEGGGPRQVSQLVEACRATSQFIASDGYQLTEEFGARAIQLSASRIHADPETLALLVVRDVSERKELEARLQHAQRMEAIGRLAGGVAHEFNNLLTIINGYASMLIDEMPADAAAQPLLREIRKSGERAAGFTRQLLAFGSKQKLEPQVLDLNDLIRGMNRMLAPLLGEDIELVTAFAPGVRMVELDPTQLEQVIINLAANARDAMPGGGRLTIATEAVILTEEEAVKRLLLGGPHVLLTVTDTGRGMDRSTLDRVFEPFFSTKERDHGTGLGLAMVYGAVHQSGGHVAVQSDVEKGTTFSIYFAASDRAPTSTLSTSQLAGTSPRGSETILVVEDDESVRTLVHQILEHAGYRVVSSRLGSEALEASDSLAGSMDLLLTDYLMPGMRGDELARHVRSRRPESRVLFMSGYANPDDSNLVHGAPFLQKPFTPTELTQRVREVLDQN